MPKPGRRIRMGSRAPLPVRPLQAFGRPIQKANPAATAARALAPLACAPLSLGLLGLGLLGLAAVVPARAELAPWVYGEQQRQAPLVVDLRILEVAPLPAGAEGLRLRGRVLAVKRQVRGGGVRTNQVLTLRLPPVPRRSQPPMVGPAPPAATRGGKPGDGLAAAGAGAGRPLAAGSGRALLRAFARSEPGSQYSGAGRQAAGGRPPLTALSAGRAVPPRWGWDGQGRCAGGWAAGRRERNRLGSPG